MARGLILEQWFSDFSHQGTFANVGRHFQLPQFGNAAGISSGQGGCSQDRRHNEFSGLKLRNSVLEPEMLGFKLFMSCVTFDELLNFLYLYIIIVMLCLAY